MKTAAKILTSFNPLTVSLVAVFFLTIPSISSADVYCYTNTGTGGINSWIGEDDGSISGGIRKAVRFTLSEECVVKAVEATIRNAGTPVDSLKAYIYDSAGSTPSSELVAGGNFPSWTATYAVGTSTLSYTLAAGTYWLVLYRTGSSSGTNYYEWRTQDSSALACAQNYNGSWAGYNCNPDFSIVGEDPVPPPTPTPDYLVATSSVDQVQRNVFYSILIFWLGVFSMVFLYGM